MTAATETTDRISRDFSDDDNRWQAIVSRDPAADGVFFYSVRTTGVYCRPACAARLALRQNVRFHATCQDAENAGFRPCKRCKPTGMSLTARHASAVALACRAIEEADDLPSLDDLASSVGMSSYHFHRIFKKLTGLTPKGYAAAHRSHRIRHELARRATVTSAIYGAGFNSNSRFYESSTELLGMTPKTFRGGGSGVVIRFAIGESVPWPRLAGPMPLRSPFPVTGSCGPTRLCPDIAGVSKGREKLLRREQEAGQL